MGSGTFQRSQWGWGKGELDPLRRMSRPGPGTANVSHDHDRAAHDINADPRQAKTLQRAFGINVRQPKVWIAEDLFLGQNIP
jgi:hypothetical protein